METTGVVGRGVELRAADLALAPLVDRGESVRLVLAADAGYGKSTLLGEVTRRAEQQGVLVLRGRAPSVGGSVLAFAPVAAALARHLDALDPNDLATLIAGLPSLGRLIETLPSEPPVDKSPADLDADTERTRLFQAVGLLLARLARTRPVLLAIDDLHWADTATVELLGYLNAELATESVGLLVALRPGDIDRRPDVRRALGDLLRGDRAARFDLGALDGAAIETLAASLLGGPLSKRLALEIANRSGGVPLAAEAIARELVAAGVLQPTAGGLDAPPEALRLPDYVIDHFRERVAELHPAERTLLLALSTAHRPAHPDELSIVAELDRDTRRDAAERLVRLRLAAADLSTARGGLEVAHPLIGEAARADAAAAELRQIHARWAEVLVAADAADDEVALHLVDAGDVVDEEMSVAVLERAGRRALSRGASDAAARWLGEAAVRSRGAAGPCRQRLGEILAAQSLTWRDVGELRAAEACLREAAREVAAADPGRAAGLLCQAADLAWVRGEAESPARQLDEAAVLAERAGPVEVVRVEAERFYLLAKQRRYDEFEASAATIDAAIARAGSTLRTELVRFNVAMARALVGMRSIDDALAMLPSSWSDGAGDGSHTSTGLAIEGFCLLGRWAEISEFLDNRPRLGGRSHSPRWWRVPAAAFDMAVATGEWGVAVDLLEGEEVVSVARLRSRHLLQHALLLGLGGRVDAAREALDRARGLGERDGSFQVIEAMATAVAVLIVDAGGGSPDEVDFDGSWGVHTAMGLPLVSSARGWWLVQRGRRDEATQFAERLVAMGSPGTRIWAIGTRIQGLSAATSDPTVGRGLLLVAADAFERLSMPFEAARARIEACESSSAPGDASFLGPDVEVLDRLDARPWAARARRITGAAPAAPRTPALTPREREIALLVAEGLSNAEIAERLYVSIRTITSHLDHAYTKLGVGSRAALSAYVVREGENT